MLDFPLGCSVALCQKAKDFPVLATYVNDLKVRRGAAAHRFGHCRLAPDIACGMRDNLEPERAWKELPSRLKTKRGSGLERLGWRCSFLNGFCDER
jgi:hypothetical protein